MDCSGEIFPIVEFPPFSTLVEKNPQRIFPVKFSSILEVPPFSRRVEFAEWIFSGEILPMVEFPPFSTRAEKSTVDCSSEISPPFLNFHRLVGEWNSRNGLFR